MATRDDAIKAAETLGEILHNTDEFKRYKLAETAYFNDAVLLQKSDEYNMQKMGLEILKDAPDSEEAKAMSKKMDALYDEIFASPVMKELSESREALEAFLDKVNETISNNMNPSEGCTPDKCASCGHCHH